MSGLTQIIYLPLRQGVRPEDPANSQEGEDLANIFKKTTYHHGYVTSAWGRTLEDENLAIWVIEWNNPTSSAPLAQLDPFLDTATFQQSRKDRKAPLSFYIDLVPRLSKADDPNEYALTKPLADNTNNTPVTELTILPFPAESEQSPDDQRATHEALIGLRTALTGQPINGDEGLRARFWSQGYVEQPATVPHEKSPTNGRASLYVLVIGWASKEAHDKVRETETFTKAIAPIRERRLKTGTEMWHVRFRQI